MIRVLSVVEHVIKRNVFYWVQGMAGQKERRCYGLWLHRGGWNACAFALLTAHKLSAHGHAFAEGENVVENASQAALQ